MRTEAISAIRTGGQILASYPGQVVKLRQEISQVKDKLKEIERERDYWQHKADEHLMESIRFEDAYRKTRRKLENSRPSSKTIAQAIADHQLAERGL